MHFVTALAAALASQRGRPAPTWSADPPIHAAPICSPGRPAAGLEHRDSTRLHAAARQATRLHPGPLGEWLERELRGLAELAVGYDPDGLTARLVDHLLEPKDGR